MPASRSTVEIAAEIVAVLPRATAWGILGRSRLPFLGDRDRENELCPMCGRRLPFTFAQLSGSGLSGTMVITHSRQEYVRACLVDGSRSAHARDFSREEIIEAAEIIVAGLARQKWKHWSRLLHKAMSRPLTNEADRIESIGQGLEAMRVYGPLGELAWPQLGGLGSTWTEVVRMGEVENSDLEILVASSGRHWRPRGSQSELPS